MRRPRLMQGFFRHHDRDVVEVFLYSIGPDDRSSYRKLIEVATEHFVDLAALDVEACAARIRADQIDVLVDTFFFGAHTTAVDALWSGLPVVTLRGRRSHRASGPALSRPSGSPSWSRPTARTTRRSRSGWPKLRKSTGSFVAASWRTGPPIRSSIRSTKRARGGGEPGGHRGASAAFLTAARRSFHVRAERTRDQAPAPSRRSKITTPKRVRRP